MGDKCSQNLTEYKNHIHSLPSKPNIKLKSQSTKLYTVIPPLGGAASFPKVMVWLSVNAGPSRLQTIHKIQLVSETRQTHTRAHTHTKSLKTEEQKTIKKIKITSQKTREICLFCFVLLCCSCHYKTVFLCLALPILELCRLSWLRIQRSICLSVSQVLGLKKSMCHHLLSGKS